MGLATASQSVDIHGREVRALMDGAPAVWRPPGGSALCRGAAVPPTQVLRGWLVALAVGCLLLVLQLLVLCGCPCRPLGLAVVVLCFADRRVCSSAAQDPLVALFVSCDARWQCSPN